MKLMLLIASVIGFSTMAHAQMMNFDGQAGDILRQFTELKKDGKLPVVESVANINILRKLNLKCELGADEQRSDMFAPDCRINETTTAIFALPTRSPRQNFDFPLWSQVGNIVSDSDKALPVIGIWADRFGAIAEEYNKNFIMFNVYRTESGYVLFSLLFPLDAGKADKISLNTQLRILAEVPLGLGKSVLLSDMPDFVNRVKGAQFGFWKPGGALEFWIAVPARN